MELQVMLSHAMRFPAYMFHGVVQSASSKCHGNGPTAAKTIKGLVGESGSFQLAL